MIMNKLDCKRKRIDCMDELYGWTGVNEGIDFMDSPNRDWKEWIDPMRNCMDWMEL